ncbi:hypothetical protein E2C01_100097 [Portunus trituberculatus]|uniref:Uncharacterized protein n=1 Tax=Portunus trituberculatus TaxID=210409 RepID=A0A5B7K5V0_PORTR|nr:hypothetical protein [Portunus trituberculatus]
MHRHYTKESFLQLISLLQPFGILILVFWKQEEEKDDEKGENEKNYNAEEVGEDNHKKEEKDKEERWKTRRTGIHEVKMNMRK